MEPRIHQFYQHCTVHKQTASRPIAGQSECLVIRTLTSLRGAGKETNQAALLRAKQILSNCHPSGNGCQSANTPHAYYVSCKVQRKTNAILFLLAVLRATSGSSFFPPFL
jgi:hypothetical protein